MVPDESSKNGAGISLRQAALIAGYGLLIMTIAAMLAEFLARQGLVVEGDPAATVQNLTEKETVWRLGIFGYIVVLIMDLLVAWALFELLKPVNRSLSLLTAWSRIVYTAIFGASLFHLLTPLQLLNDPGTQEIFGSEQLNAMIMQSLNSFTDGWGIGFIFFGLHLSLLGYLAYRADYIPRILGVLVFLAGLSYLVDYTGKLMSPEFTLTLSLYLGWGELILMLWLVVRGGRLKPR
jgi:hypothetical protein